MFLEFFSNILNWPFLKSAIWSSDDKRNNLQVLFISHFEVNYLFIFFINARIRITTSLPNLFRLGFFCYLRPPGSFWCPPPITSNRSFYGHQNFRWITYSLFPKSRQSLIDATTKFVVIMLSYFWIYCQDSIFPRSSHKAKNT